MAQLRERQSRLWQASPIARVRDAAARHAGAPRSPARRPASSACAARASGWLPLARTLHAVSPLATLERGYAIVTGERGGDSARCGGCRSRHASSRRASRKGRIRAKVANT